MSGVESAEAVTVARTPSGSVTVADFAITPIETGEPAGGEVVVEVDSWSLDPYQRIVLKGLPVGSTPPAAVVGRVIDSDDATLPVGTWVIGEGRWASHVTVAAAGLRRIEVNAQLPAHFYLGALGLSGLTGYLAARRVGQVRAGDVVVVTGALGGVGQVAAQVARADGAIVAGVVGGPDKVARLSELAIQAFDHRSSEWLSELDEWAPEGVDVLIDNVWNATSARVFERLRPGGRVVVCGQISGVEAPAVPPLPIDDWFRLITKSLTLRGFRAVEYADEHDAARVALGNLIASGQITPTVQIVDGLAQAPTAFVDMMNGRTWGKVVVTVRGH